MIITVKEGIIFLDANFTLNHNTANRIVFNVYSTVEIMEVIASRKTSMKELFLRMR